jgi:ABC-type multidrug transport system ATPase subunit
MQAITVSDISKSYGNTVALDHISLQVNEGEIFGLIGPDGAGKTSLIRILTSLVFADSGSSQVLGLDPVNDFKKLREKLGYMPGRFSLYHDLSVQENLSLFASIFETTIEENYHLVKDIYVQLEPFKNRRSGALSGGMKQKLALCCAMIHKPEILFLDEPTTGVDPVSRKEFWEMLKKLNADGLTIFVSTPYMDEASLCHRVALMQDGRIMATDTPENISLLFPKKLYALQAKDKYKLLKTLRDYEHTHSAYSFGSEIHYADKRSDFHPEMLSDVLQNKEHTKINEITPGIEDTFMDLMTTTHE